MYTTDSFALGIVSCRLEQGNMGVELGRAIERRKGLWLTSDGDSDESCGDVRVHHCEVERILPH